MRRIGLRIAVGCALVAAGFAVPLAAQRPALTMLDQIEPGRWEFHERGSSRVVDRLCVSSARQFIQLRHQQDSCERLIIADGPAEVTVQYTCRGHGYGLTRIRRETSQLIQLDTQGIADGLPFDFAMEARRTGACTR